VGKQAENYRSFVADFDKQVPCCPVRTSNYLTTVSRNTLRFSPYNTNVDVAPRYRIEGKRGVDLIFGELLFVNFLGEVLEAAHTSSSAFF